MAHEVSLALSQKAPSCTQTGHAFERELGVVGGDKSNPGVFANALGTVVSEVCKWCRLRRVSNTLASDPSRVSVSYLPWEG